MDKREYNAKYLSEHREENRVRSSRYYYAHRERALAKRREYVKDNKDVIDAKKKWDHLQRTYGMSKEEWETRMEAQGYRCPICQRSFSEVRPCVDHDHETGEVRGILCVSCNAAIGQLQDDPANCDRAGAYLREYINRELPLPKVPNPLTYNELRKTNKLT